MTGPAVPPRLSRDMAAPRAGIVHLGLGAFFRAHGAPVIAQAVAEAGGDWGIIGASLRHADIRDRLVPQDHVYTAVALTPEGQDPKVVHVLNDVLFARDAPEALIARMADPGIRLVTLTVTEKGYCHVPSTGALDPDHTEIRHDMTQPTPQSAPGFVVRALQRRFRAGLRPFTVLSCDNLPDNGRVARNVVVGLARLIDPELARWIETEARFPATMVDRIVPATTDADIAGLAALTGRSDHAPVFHEPFLQWVIEEDFVDGDRPALHLAEGVEMVTDVAPYEVMKLRMLNGTHSALAYLGYLSGHQTIAETVADPAFRPYLQRIWNQEIIPTVTPPPGADLRAYADALLARYENPAIRHRTWQIAMDGSQKLPQRILGTIADNMARGRPNGGLFLAVAGWMRYVGGVDEKGLPIDVRDPLAARLRALSDNAGTPADKAAALLSVTEVFGTAPEMSLCEGVVAAYEDLVKHGARACVARLG